MKKSNYELQLEKILTPEVLSEMKSAEEKRFQKVIDSIKDENEEFLEKLKDWIGDYLNECYSYGD